MSPAASPPAPLPEGEFPPRLFATVAPDRPRPRCATRTRGHDTAAAMRAARSTLSPGSRIEEVIDHPILPLMRFDLWEMTQLSLEVHGTAYWLLDLDPLLEEPRAI